jgi:hypothetical protein
LEDTAGISPDGEAYDAIQRNIVANHIAIVDRGRAGAGARVRMDNAGIMTFDPDLISATAAPEVAKKENNMEIKEALEQLAKATARADAYDAKASDLAKQVETLQGERDALKSAVEKAEKARTDSENSIESRVRARVELESKVSSLLKDTPLVGLSDRAIKIAAIKKMDGVELNDQHPDPYINGRFDASIDRNTVAVEQLAAVRSTEVKTDSEDVEVVSRRNMITLLQGAK